MFKEKAQHYFLVMILLAVMVLVFLVVKPYIAIIAIAAALAVALRPVHNFIVKFIPSRGLAAFLATLVTILLILIPLATLGSLALNEAINAYHQVSSRASQIQPALADAQAYLDKLAPTIGFSVDINGTLAKIASWVVGNLDSLFSGLAQGIIGFLLTMFMLYYFFQDGHRFRQFFIDHSPLPDKEDIQIAERVERAINSVMRGSILIALMQGILTGAGFAIFGVPSPALWGSLAVIAALVPTLGTTLINIPGVIFLAATGHSGAAIGLAIWAGVAVGMVDNFLSPRLVARGTHMHPLVVLLSVIGGLELFGPVGFLIGPLVFSLFFSLLDIYFATSNGAKT
ncbi:MAG: AI-2E family transporter [Patescibacteria group bacterium]